MSGSLADQAVAALALVASMDNDITNDDPHRHAVRALKRIAEQSIANGLRQACELAYQAKDLASLLASQQAAPQEPTP